MEGKGEGAVGGGEGSVLCIIGCLATSLASIYKMPVAPPSLALISQSKMSLESSKSPLEELTRPQVESYDPSPL